MNRPFVLIKTAMSVDGRIGTSDRQSIQLSNDLDRAAVDKLRSEYDAILVGETTLVNDNPRLVLRNEEYRNFRKEKGLSLDPVKVTISKRCDLATSLRFFQLGEARKFVFTTLLASQEDMDRVAAFATVVVCGDERVDIEKMLSVLKAEGVDRLMVEGGGSTNHSFLQAGVVDELRVAVCPQLVGGTGATLVDGSFVDETLELLGVEQLGQVVVLRYKVKFV